MEGIVSLLVTYPQGRQGKTGKTDSQPDDADDGLRFVFQQVAYRQFDIMS
jgi:hypothetical protein